MKGMRGTGRAVRGLARMLLEPLQKKRQLENKQTRGDVQMPASIQFCT